MSHHRDNIGVYVYTDLTQWSIEIPLVISKSTLPTYGPFSQANTHILELITSKHLRLLFFSSYILELEIS